MTRVVRWLGISALVLAVDRITKLYVTYTLDVGEYVPVLPVFARTDARGGIEIEILPPLADDPTVRDRRARTRILVEAYVRLLEARWSQTPAEVLIPSMRAYARLPTSNAEAVAGQLAGAPRPAEGGVWGAS